MAKRSSGRGLCHSSSEKGDGTHYGFKWSHRAFTAEELNTNPIKTRFLKGSEVHNLAKRQCQVHGPKEMAGQREVRRFMTGDDVCPLQKKLEICTLDRTLAKIVQTVHAASLGGALDARPRYIISNIEEQGERGLHWFTVAFSVSEEPE